MIEDIIITILATIILLAIILPWISLCSLNGIERELRKIRQIIERGR